MAETSDTALRRGLRGCSDSGLLLRYRTKETEERARVKIFAPTGSNPKLALTQAEPLHRREGGPRGSKAKQGKRERGKGERERGKGKQGTRDVGYRRDHGIAMGNGKQ